MREIEAHLETRLVATGRPECDVTDARAAAREPYAALWNLGGAMPESLVRLRGRQRDECAAELGRSMGAGDWSRAGIERMQGEMRAFVESPFQPLLVMRLDESTTEWFRGEYGSRLERVRQDFARTVAAMREADADGEPELREWTWSQFASFQRLNFMAFLNGAAMDGVRHRASFANPRGDDYHPALIGNFGNTDEGQFFPRILERN